MIDQKCVESLHLSQQCQVHSLDPWWWTWLQPISACWTQKATHPWNQSTSTTRFDHKTRLYSLHGCIIPVSSGWWVSVLGPSHWLPPDELSWSVCGTPQPEQSVMIIINIEFNKLEITWPYTVCGERDFTSSWQYTELAERGVMTNRNALQPCIYNQCHYVNDHAHALPIGQWSMRTCFTPEFHQLFHSSTCVLLLFQLRQSTQYS